MLLLSSKDVHTRPFLTADPRVAVYLTGRLAAALLEEKKTQQTLDISRGT